MLYNRWNEATVGIKIAFEKLEQSHVKSQPTVHQKQFLFALKGSLLVGQIKETSEVSNVQRNLPLNLHHGTSTSFGSWKIRLEPNCSTWNLHLELVELCRTW